jgi:hypothetical protein
MDKQTERAIKTAAKEFAGFLVRHPMLGAMLNNKLVAAKVSLSDENQSVMLEETAHQLYRMVHGS